MNHCRQCKNEINDRESRGNQGLCDECAFSADAPAQVEQAATTIAAMRAAVAEVPSHVERYARQAQAEAAELEAFDAQYLEKHGVYAALCDVPEHLQEAALRVFMPFG